VEGMSGRQRDSDWQLEQDLEGQWDDNGGSVGIWRSLRPPEGL